jgi:hypothetical protein
MKSYKNLTTVTSPVDLHRRARRAAELISEARLLIGTLEADTLGLLTHLVDAESLAAEVIARLPQKRSWTRKGEASTEAAPDAPAAEGPSFVEI